MANKSENKKTNPSKSSKSKPDDLPVPLKSGPPDTDNNPPTLDQIKSFIKELVDFHLQAQKEEIATLKAEVIELQSTQAFISQKYDELKLDYEALSRTNKRQKEEIIQLSENSVELAMQASYNQVGQYEQNLEFKGIPEQENEDTNKIVVQLAKLLDVEINDSEISVSHRLPPRSKPTIHLLTDLTPSHHCSFHK